MKKRGMTYKRILSIVMAVIMLLTLNSFSVFATTVDNSYKTGTYTGESKGYKDGAITVTVTLNQQDDAMKITDIQAEGQNQTESYWEEALVILEQIKKNNGTDGVDVITGATLSCKGILNATDDALAKALSENVFDRGAGTKTNPYIISSVDTMKAFSAAVEAGNSYKGKYIALSNNIDLGNVEWTPIGDKTHLFEGIFNGKGYTISDLTMGSKTAPVNHASAGLFGYVAASAQILNVNLTNVEIYTNTQAVSYAGAVVAFAKVDSSVSQGTVFNNCHANGTISVNTGDKGAAMVGGIVGFGNQMMTLANCGADVDVTASTGSKNANAGGLVGFESIKSLTINSYSYGDVVADSTNINSNVGGLVGGANGMLYNNYTSSNVTAPQTLSKTGALAGSTATASILSHCYYDKDKSVHGVGDAKGLTGTDGNNGKTAAEMKSAEFASLLASNLSDSAKKGFAKEVQDNSSVLTGCNYEARTAAVNDKYYNWVCTEGTVTHSDEFWANSTIDESIFAGGQGTKEDPYTIDTEKQLRDFAVSLTAKLDYTDVYIKLNKNLELKEGRWIPIGEGEYAFNGHFDGANHTIKGLTIGSKTLPYEDPTGEKAGVYFGLFGVLDSKAEVKNLTIDAEINVTSAQSIYVSALAGYANEALVDGVTVLGTIKGTTTHKSGNIFVGGITGSSLRQKIINSESHADVRAEAVGGLAEAGGIIGLLNRGLIANCYSTGTITGNADRKAEGAPSLGGIAAVNAGTVLNCYSLSNISADCYTGYVGALIGWATGIADTFQSYYCKTTEIVTDSKTDAKNVISPAVAIGWSVGPGINDEGEPYTGSVSLNVKGLDEKDIINETFAKQLTDNISHLNADLAKGGRQSGHWTGSGALAKSLRSWKLADGKVVLDDKTVQADYDAKTNDAINALLPEEAPEYYEGEFYGRNKEKDFVVKVNIGEESKITNIVTLEGSGDYADVISNILEGKLSVKDLEDSTFKSALEIALKKASSNDTTTYGKATSDIFAQGEGTKEKPWIINTRTQLIDFAKSVNEDEDYSGKYVKLGKNIRLIDEWLPAGGTNPWPFAGTFDGDGHTISDLQIGSSDAPYSGRFAGMFAYVRGGTVKNVNLTGVDVNIKNTGKDRIYAGGLIAAADSKQSDGEIDNVCVSGKIRAHSNSGASYAGGIIGQCSGGVITNSFAEVNVYAVSDAAWVYAGALEGIGAWNGVINNYAKGTVKAKAPVNKAAVGGITGFQSGVVYNCWSDVDVIASSSTGDVGGVAGRNTGIGLMLTSYYNAEAHQKSGGKDVAEKKAVGTIVNGDNQGKGIVEGLVAVDDIAGQAFADQLNKNSLDSSALARVHALLESESWGAGKADDRKLSTWKTSSKGSVRLMTTEEMDAESSKAEAEANATPDKVTGVKASSTSYNSVKLSWKTASKAKGYIVYRADSKNGDYEEVYATRKTSLTDTDLKTGKTYWYKVAAYTKTEYGTLKGAMSSNVSAKPSLAKVSNVKAKAGVKKATVSWNKVAGASGYKVYRSTKKSSGYKLVKTIKNSKQVKFTNENLSKKKTYYYKVKAYRVVNGKNVYGDYSSVVKVKTK